jgi:hypothetical protein
LPGIQFDKQLPRLHSLALLKVYRDDTPIDFRFEVDRFIGQHGTNHTKLLDDRLASRLYRNNLGGVTAGGPPALGLPQPPESAAMVATDRVIANR